MNVANSVDTIEELAAGATDRRPVRSSDAKSGADFELLTIDGRSCFLKVLDAESDWIMRVTGNADHWEYKVWRAGLYHHFPDAIDHTIIAMALDTTGDSPRLGILMDDVSGSLIPPGDDVVAAGTHDGFVRHMAQLHADFWGWQDTVGLCPMANRIRFFSPEIIAPELLADTIPGPIAAADAGWKQLASIHPELSGFIEGIHEDPSGLVDALAESPSTFVTGDWKMGNLGRHADGRTILVDQAYPGEAPGLYDLLWYVALNRQRLPVSKEATIDAYRAGLEAAGIDTDGWFERQLGLSLIAVMATFAWEKALGDADELAWWSTQVAEIKRVAAMTAADGLAFARRGYESAAPAWAEDAELVYGPLADALLARAPELAGQLVMDVGAGTGAVSQRLLAAGAHAIAVDASWPMLAHQAPSRPPAVVGDISRLPLVDGAVDGAAAAFVLNHLADPAAALVEIRRVVRRGGFIVASVFSIADPPTAKAAIDATLARAGWEPPEWYRFLKSVDRQLGTAATMRVAAQAAELEHIDVVEQLVQTGVTAPRDIVRYRLSQPQRALFLAGLSDTARRRVFDECVAAVAERGEAFDPGVVLLAARV